MELELCSILFLAPGQAQAKYLLRIQQQHQRKHRGTRKDWMQAVTRDATPFTTKDSCPLPGPASPSCPDLEFRDIDFGDHVDLDDQEIKRCKEISERFMYLCWPRQHPWLQLLGSCTTASVKRHTGSDSRWKAIRTVNSKDPPLGGLNLFKLLERLGYGDIGSVYHLFLQ